MHAQKQLAASESSAVALLGVRVRDKLAALDSRADEM
jgi:hypothetical protein